MPTATKIPLASVTLSATTTSVTFGSISQSYTDLILVANFTNVGGDAKLVFNSDTGSNYSLTYLVGSGSAASSGRASNQSNGFYLDQYGSLGNVLNTFIFNIMNYSNTSTYKTTLNRWAIGNSAYPTSLAQVNLWRSTSAISTVSIQSQAQGFASGSTFNLYGIL